jgi:hypothetical protein
MGKRVISIFLACCIAFISVPAFLYAENASVVIDETVLEPKDPILATVVAIGPGLLVHGFGHYFTEDYKMGMYLTGLEILSIGMMAFGAAENTNVDMFRIFSGSRTASQTSGAWIFAAGFFTFAGTWLVDIFLAGDSAKQYNREHNLEFKLQQESRGLDTQFALLYKYNF